MNCSARELTARGVGAVSVVVLEGADALEIARELCATPRLGVGDVRLVRLRLHGEELDEALAVVLGADQVELHLHGAPALVRALLLELPARAGSRSSLEQRAEDLLAGARSEGAARILLDQVEGALRRELELIASSALDSARARLTALAARSRSARFALEPAVLVLAGPTNVGKSTLFNVLVGERRALVRAEPGTTRDLVRVDALLGSWPVTLVDTAGERVLEDSGAAASVEREGQRRARLLRESADLVLWLSSCEAISTSPASAIALHTRADLHASPPPGAISALKDPAGAAAHVALRVRERLGLPAEPWEPGAAILFEPAQRADVGALLARAADPRALARDLLGR